MQRRLTKTTRAPRPSMAVLEAFGEPDDHLRLSTLIADAVIKADVVTRALDSAAAATLRGVARRLTDDRGPRSWRDRRPDFMEVTRLMPSGAVVLRDPDAFADPSLFDGSADWDDATLCRERGEFFESLMGAIARGAIELERTAPDPRFSRRLASAAVSVPDARVASAAPADPYAPHVGPDARGALGWLLRGQHLDEGAVDELIEEGAGPKLDRHLILVAYDHLPRASREAAYRLAVLRGEQALNGAIGPFAVQARPAAAAVARAQVEALLACGFLRRTAADGRVRMPRIVREVVLARADAEDPDAVVKDHELAFAHLQRSGGPSLVDGLIELHHHAVRGLLIQQAIATAKFYATDLRELAIRLSRKEQWLAAADVYRKVVERDPEDAYAWEYLGYNLARAQPRRHAAAIEAAYARAHEIEPANPLYHGRLLGFRARVGHSITAEFRHWIDIYTYNGVDRFASEVLKGLRRGDRDPTAKRLLAAHPWLLKYPEVKRIMEAGWGRRSPE